MNEKSKQAYEEIISDKRLFKTDDHIDASKLALVFSFVPNYEEHKKDIMLKLTKEGYLLKPTGRATYSNLQAKLKDFIDNLVCELHKNRKASIQLSEEECNLIEEHNEEYVVRNLFNDRIVTQCNFKNVTSEELKKLAEEEKKNGMNKK